MGWFRKWPFKWPGRAQAIAERLARMDGRLENLERLLEDLRGLPGDLHRAAARLSARGADGTFQKEDKAGSEAAPANNGDQEASWRHKWNQKAALYEE